LVSETELKFGLSETAAVAVDATLRRVGRRAVPITSHYWDTADRRLAHAGLSLRLRHAKGRWEQTVKGAGAGPVERLEQTVPRPGEWSENGPSPELGYYAGSEAGALLDAALSRRRGRVPALEPQYTSIVVRRAVPVVVAGADIEVAVDRGVVRAGARSMPVCEVELELKHGDAAALIALGREGIDSHGMWLSTIAKATRGERLSGGAAALGATKAKPAQLRQEATGAAIFRAVARSCFDQIVANASVIAAGDVDDETVHQLRIGIRRMRTAWRELGIWRGSLGPQWEAPAAEVFRALGAYRDQRTVAAAMQQCLAAAGSPDPALAPDASAAAVDPVTTVRSPAFQHALLDLLAFLIEPGPASDPASEAGGDDGRSSAQTIGRRFDKLHARLKRDAKRFEELDGPARHRVRKRLKRLRYLGELVAPLYKTGRVEKFLRALVPAQDALGHYMDIVVAIGLAQDKVASGDVRAWFNVGWLQAQLPEAVEHCGRALQRVVAAAPFWH
jgi:inorganic triphosphatase YgiF